MVILIVEYGLVHMGGYKLPHLTARPNRLLCGRLGRADYCTLPFRVFVCVPELAGDARQ